MFLSEDGPSEYFVYCLPAGTLAHVLVPKLELQVTVYDAASLHKTSSGHCLPFVNDLMRGPALAHLSSVLPGILSLPER